MPRLSCSFCVLASRSALVRAAQLRPDLARDYVAAEERMAHRFRQDMSIADVLAEAERSPAPSAIEGWTA